MATTSSVEPDPASAPTKSVTPPEPALTSRRLTPLERDRVRRLVWGKGEPKVEVFDRWSQGFTFSEDEPTALVQDAGGPCAVIMPVQGYIIKNLLLGITNDSDDWRQKSHSEAGALLVAALAEMLTLVAPPNGIFNVVTVEEKEDYRRQKHEHEIANGVDRGAEECPSSSVSPPKKPRMSLEEFHANLGVIECTSSGQLTDALTLLESRGDLRRRSAVLAFLYSLLLTKGIDNMLVEVEDSSEPLIEVIFGHGSQSLVNLQISGVAVSNVFDEEKDLGGFKLRGIASQAPIGFLSFLEHLRYCEVGWYLKNPSCPVWVLGSETHFTLLFSTDQRLIVKDSPATFGRRAFSQLDPEGNGFISADLLKDLLASLDFVSEPPEYVKIMKEKLDPEGLEIIVLTNFLREFYGDSDYENVNEIPKSFPLYHYNGLKKTGNPGLSYAKCIATIDEPGIIVTDATPIKLCLQTKWPTLEINWVSGNTPSLN